MRSNATFFLGAGGGVVVRGRTRGRIERSVLFAPRGGREKDFVRFALRGVLGGFVREYGLLDMERGGGKTCSLDKSGIKSDCDSKALYSRR